MQLADGASAALADAAEVYRRDRTEGQDVALYLGVEKAATACSAE